MDLREVISDRTLPTRFGEVALIDGYLDAGSPHGDPIYLSLGETWTEVAPGLAATLASPVPARSHGYVVTQYGLPRLQSILREYIPRSHGIPDSARVGQDFEVAVACSGTRNVMFDFARLLNQRGAGTRPAAVVFAPGWDYATVFSAAGYDVHPVRLRQEDGFHPSPDAFRFTLDRLGHARPALVAINAQHNPTAVNWRRDDVREMVRTAFAAGMAVLVDDAYFALHDPGVRPTSTLRIVIDESARFPDADWLAVRSLGKQFNCNGWGIGAVTGPPAIIDRLVNDVQFERSFMCALPLQEAMATWLENRAAEEYLVARRAEFAHKRDAVVRFLVDDLRYPADAFHRGECTSYLRFAAPGCDDAQEVTAFRERVFHDSGVLLGIDPADGSGATPWLRMFLGPPLHTLTIAMKRLAEVGWRHDRPVAAP